MGYGENRGMGDYEAMAVCAGLLRELRVHPEVLTGDEWTALGDLVGEVARLMGEVGVSWESCAVEVSGRPRGARAERLRHALTAAVQERARRR